MVRTVVIPGRARRSRFITVTVSAVVSCWLILATLSIIGAAGSGPSFVINGIDVSGAGGFAAAFAGLGLVELTVISMLGAAAWAIAVAAYRSPRGHAYLIARAASVAGVLLATTVPLLTVSYLRALGMAIVTIGVCAALALWAGVRG
jgi:hypothetical protein